MLRALVSAGVAPVVLGTSVGAVNGAVFASAPTAGRSTGSRPCGPGCPTTTSSAVRRCGECRRWPARAPTHSSTPLRDLLTGALGEGAGSKTCRCASSASPPASSAPPSTGSWRTGDRRGDGQQCGSRAATAGGDRRRALPRRRLGPLDTGRAGDALGHAPCTSCMSAGSSARSNRRAVLGGGNGGLRDRPRHRFAADMAAVPDDVTVHLPTGDPDPPHYAGRSVLRYRDTSRVAERIQLADEAVTAYLARVTCCPAMVPSRGHRTCGRRRDVGRPDQCPVVAARRAAVSRGYRRWRPLRFSGSRRLRRPGTGQPADPVRLWIATGFGAAMNASRSTDTMRSSDGSCGCWSGRHDVCSVCVSSSRARGRRTTTIGHWSSSRTPARRLVPGRPLAGELVRARSPHRAQGHAAVGSGDRHRAQPAAQPVHRPNPGADGGGRGTKHRRTGGRARPRRRAGHLPRGWKLHRRAQGSCHRGAAAAGPRTQPTRPSGWSTSWHRAGRCHRRPAGRADADAVFVAHTGLEHLVTVADLWRGLPMDTEIGCTGGRSPQMRHRVPRTPCPEWLYGWWERVDAWIGAHRP